MRGPANSGGMELRERTDASPRPESTESTSGRRLILDAARHHDYLAARLALIDTMQRLADSVEREAAIDDGLQHLRGELCRLLDVFAAEGRGQAQADALARKPREDRPEDDAREEPQVEPAYETP